MANMRGCPNLDVKVEGKGIISSGHYVAKCRAQGGREMDPDQVIRLCVHNPYGEDFVQCCAYRNKTMPLNAKPSYTNCRYCDAMYR